MRNDLRYWAEAAPEKTVLEFEHRPAVTFAELEVMANRFASLFRSHGLRPGDHVAVILHNQPEIIGALWGAYRAGVYLTPVANSFSASELAYVVANSDASLVIADERFNDKLYQIEDMHPGPAHRFIIGERAGWQPLGEALAAQSARPLPAETPGSLMLYTSGTTGAPKGVIRPLPTSEQIGGGPPHFAGYPIELYGLSPQTRYLSTAPLYHAAPMVWAFSVTAGGGTAFIMSKFDPEAALSHLEQHAITHSQWVPTMFSRLLALPEERRAGFHAPHHIAAWHAAAPCPVPVKRQMIEWWGPIINEYYGGSESVGQTLLTSPEWLERPGTVGRARRGTIHILDDGENDLPPGTVGGVYFDPPSKFAYYKDPEKTAAQTSRQGYQTFGDIGYLDNEGYLFLTDRKNDVIISGGVNLYPQEIEQAVQEVPEVDDCAVAARPDGDFGERPVAFVLLRPGASDPEALVSRIRDFCRQRLGTTKQPAEIRIVNELPRTETGKILRRVLRDQLRAEVTAN